MKKMVNFCDICNADGVSHLATHEYWSGTVKWVVCTTHKADVEASGFPTSPLPLDEEFIADVLEGILDDLNAK